jgi:hypothetical protein
MSSSRLERTLSVHPAWRAPLESVLAALKGVASGKSVDPLVVSHNAHLPLAETLAFLQVLTEAGIGTLAVRVVDDRGLEVGRYARVGDVPHRIETKFGDEIEPSPENVEIVFVAA